MIEMLLEKEGDFMDNLVSVKSFDGTIVRIPKDKIVTFNARQGKIRQLMDEGKSKQDIRELIKEERL